MWLLTFTLWHKKECIRKYDTLTNIFTKGIGDKTSQDKKIEETSSREEMKKIHPKHLPMEVLIKYKNSSNVDYVIQRKKIIQGFIINKIEIIHAKNVFFFFFFYTLRPPWGCWSHCYVFLWNHLIMVLKRWDR